MEFYITSCIAGFIAFNQDHSIIDYKLFNQDEIASKIIEKNQGNILSEEIELIESCSDDYDKIIIESNNRISSYSDLKNFENIQIATTSIAGEYLRKNLEDILVDLPGFSTKKDFKFKINNIFREIAILKMKEASGEEDKLLIQAINSIDEIDESISKLVERMREWNVIYFPEIDTIQNNESYIKIIAESENREEIIENPPDSLQTIFENKDIDVSNGADLDKEDIEIINDFGKSIHSLQNSRSKIEDYISLKMEKIAPNLKNLIGASLGAKLISHGGSLMKLATYPSGTIQIMGAEKALFRHLKTGERPPKHGLIFQHPEVRTSPRWIRGKIARTLALKISLSVRKDVFSGKFDPTIAEGFLEKVEQIKKENPFPTKTTKRRREEKEDEKDKRKGSKKFKKSKKQNKRKYKSKKGKKGKY